MSLELKVKRYNLINRTNEPFVAFILSKAAQEHTSLEKA